ncbi:MAG: ethanolamine ammonia-lyase subunit EutC [Oscillospiraceae bacterium]
MVNQEELRKVIQQVLTEMNVSNETTQEQNTKSSINIKETKIEDGCLKDITEVDLRQQYLVPNPVNKQGYLEMKAFSPARLGIWRAGARYLTETSLRFRADHSVAQDSVFSYVSEDFLKNNNLFTVETLCKDKDEYVTRPDLGKKLTEDSVKIIKEKCKMKPTVQICIADGLSSAAIEANIKDVLPAIIQGLKSYGIDVGLPFFVKLGRVGVMDVVSETLNADVTCLLVGERPGLVTAESMSAYIAYKATVDMPEARRTVVSNIHKGGLVPVEAGAHVAEIIKLILDKKCSGTDLQL